MRHDNMIQIKTRTVPSGCSQADVQRPQWISIRKLAA
jgi:hypothetical protein